MTGSMWFFLSCFCFSLNIMKFESTSSHACDNNSSLYPRKNKWMYAIPKHPLDHDRQNEVANTASTVSRTFTNLLWNSTRNILMAKLYLYMSSECLPLLSLDVSWDESLGWTETLSHCVVSAADGNVNWRQWNTTISGCEDAARTSRQYHTFLVVVKTSEQYALTTCFTVICPARADLNNLNFHPLEAVGSDPQLQVDENYSCLFNFSRTHLRFQLISNTFHSQDYNRMWRSKG